MVIYQEIEISEIYWRLDREG